MSQLDLALEADISSRHLSFVESGRAQPSREMLTNLADALTVPLRERNALFLSAGFAPVHRETGLNNPDMALAHRAIDYILKQQEPYPAVVLDRHWDITMFNKGATALVEFILDSPPAEPNMVRQIFSDEIMRPYIVNWEEVACDIIRRLHQEIDWVPTDKALQDLLSEVLSSPHVPPGWRTRPMEVQMPPTLNFVLRKGDTELSFFSTWTSFAAPHDVTLQELRIECSFPADERTEKTWRQIVSGIELK